MNSVELFQLPSQVRAEDLSGKVAVAVDVLRASTTIVTALHNGAAEVFPFKEIESARLFAKCNTNALLGGERKGLRIEGFDLSNSPTAYDSNSVSGRTVAFTSTNGTIAIEQCRGSHTTLIGCFVNLHATCHWIRSQNRPLAIVCAGTDGQPTAEDTLFGGALISGLAGFSEPPNSDGRADPDNHFSLNLAARTALQLWRSTNRQIEQGQTLESLLCRAQGGVNLVRLGLRDDILFAATLNRFDLVAIHDQSDNAIRQSPSSDVDLTAKHR